MTEPTRETSPGPATTDEELLGQLADDFAVRRRRGEHPTVEEYIAKYPALAERIRNVLSAVGMIEQTVPPDLTPGERPGSTIGRYKLLERIGEGGFGVVYMAEQQEPVRRKVALKIVKPGMDSRQVLARFEAERQALAIMDHPNIARVLDAGATDSGRPYFVMELVKGEPITEYCDRNQFSPRQRLELFAQVCHAVQHAHQKGIIHRDIKPTNVLVMMHDTTPVVKVIDFGVAKALGQELTEKTLFTAFAELIGTPLYMSPEQAGQSGLDVDTRSDIYSLGVLLYELLTGTTPFDKERFRQAAQDEVRRIIREEEPPRPSTRLSESKDSLPSISAQRHTEPAKLTKLVRGELDWIVMKALEKDRARRYETANGFARDVERYLYDEPVTACPPSAAYRFRKFVRRNKGPVAAGAAVVLALAFGLALATVGFIQARHQRAIAQENAARADREADSANKERSIALDQAARADREAQKARTEAEKQAAVTRFITDMFSEVAPEDSRQVLRPKDITVMQLMDAATKQLDAGSLRNSPEVEFAVRGVLSSNYRKIGQLSGAERHARAELELAKRIYGPRDPSIAISLHNICEVLVKQGNLKEAEKLEREALTILEERFGAEHASVARPMRGLADVLEAQGKLSDAEDLYRRALAIELTADGTPTNPRSRLYALDDLVRVLKAQDKRAEVEMLLRDALATNRKKGESTGLASAIIRFADWVHSEGQCDEAEQMYREALALRRKVFGTQDPELELSRNRLANALRAHGKTAELEQIQRETLEIRRQKLPADHPDVIDAMIELAWAVASNHKFSEADALCKQALAIQRGKGPTTQLASTLAASGEVYQAAGQFTEAERLCREALDLRRKLLGEVHRDIELALGLLARILVAQGKLADAESVWREDLEMETKLSGDEHPLVANSLRSLAGTLEDQGKWAEAETANRKALEIRRNKLPPNDRLISESLVALGMMLCEQEKAQEAEPLLREGLKLRESASPKNKWSIANAQSYLGRALTLLGKFDEAEQLLLAACAQFEDAPLTWERRRRSGYVHVTKLYDAWGKPDKAAEWRAKQPATNPAPPPQ